MLAPLAPPTNYPGLYPVRYPARLVQVNLVKAPPSLLYFNLALLYFALLYFIASFPGPRVSTQATIPTLSLFIYLPTYQPTAT